MTHQEYIAAIKGQQSLIRKLFSSRRRRSEIIVQVTQERYQHLVGKFFRPEGNLFKSAANDIYYYICGIYTTSNYVMSDRVSVEINCRYIGRMYCDKQIDGICTGYQTFSFNPDDDLDEILAPMWVDYTKAINTIDGYYAEMKENFLKKG